MPSSIWQFGNLHVDLTQVARLFNLLFCILHKLSGYSSDVSGTHHLSKHHIVKITPLYDVFNTGIITSRIFNTASELPNYLSLQHHRYIFGPRLISSAGSVAHQVHTSFRVHIIYIARGPDGETYSH